MPSSRARVTALCLFLLTILAGPLPSQEPPEPPPTLAAETGAPQEAPGPPEEPVVPEAPDARAEFDELWREVQELFEGYRAAVGIRRAGPGADPGPETRPGALLRRLLEPGSGSAPQGRQEAPGSRLE